MTDVSWSLRWELFHFPIFAALIAGLVCPLIGTMLFLRRTSFYGIALPQFAAAGIVCGFAAIPWWFEHIGFGGLTPEEALADAHAAINYHFLWAAAFTLSGLYSLAWLGRRGGSEIGRVAAAFALANACTYLFGRLSPVGLSFVTELFQSEILSVGRHEIEVLAGAYGLAFVLTCAFHRDFVLMSFDRDYAIVLGKRVFGLELLLNSLIGITVAVGTIIVGPTLLFGLLIVPTLVARRWAKSMSALLVLAPVVGLVSTLLGILISFELDLPLGASIVAATLVFMLPGVCFPARAPKYAGTSEVDP